VTAALVVYHRPGRRRDRPTVQELWTAYDQLRGGDGAGAGRALYAWFKRLRNKKLLDVTYHDAIDDAEALRDAWRAEEADPGGVRRRRGPDA